MARPRRPALGRGARLVPLAAVATLVVVLFVLPGATLGATQRPHGAALPAASGPIAATVTWNGANVLNYTSPTSAVHIGFNGVVNVHYAWTSTLGTAAPPTINDARLQIFYFGFALATRDVVDSAALPATSGQFTMNWSTGALEYILEGSYRLVASLLAPNGTTVWSQTFWAFVAAPFYIGALLPIVLILIVVWEIYNLATVGRQAVLGKRPPSTPPTDTSSSATSSTTTDASPPPSADSTPPPSGGGS
jgi:hypothetical protein